MRPAEACGAARSMAAPGGRGVAGVAGRIPGGEGMEGEGPYPEEWTAWAESCELLAAIAAILRCNWHSRLPVGGYGPGEAEALAAEALQRLLDPEGFMQTEVGGVRFDLEVGSEIYPTEPVIWASVWDEETEVWRRVARVELRALLAAVSPLALDGACHSRPMPRPEARACRGAAAPPQGLRPWHR